MSRARRLCVCLVTGLALASTRAGAAEPDATAIAVAADAAHDAGRLDESAALYARAYRAMSPEQRAVLGEVIVAAALEDLRASFEATGDLAHATLAGELLDSYASPLPEALAVHRPWIDDALHVASPATTHGDELEIDAVPQPAARRERAAPSDRAPPKPQRSRAAPLAIGLGAAATIAGIATIAFAAPLASRAEQQRSRALADPRFVALDPNDPETIAYEAGYDAYVEHEQLRTRVFTSIGAIVLAAGIGATAYGVTLLVRKRRSTPRNLHVRAIAGGLAF